jgi:hypothetical protein
MPVLKINAPCNRAGRRKIIKELGRVYVDDEVGYMHGEGDETVAKRLGMPLDWVTSLRDQLFGPIGQKGEKVMLRREIEALRREVDLWSKRTVDGASKLENLLHALVKRLETIKE